jgi:ribosomal protein S18 acetylase RimI-like enzyme
MTVSRDEAVRIRPLREADIEAIIAIDAEITGEGKPGFWRGLLTLYDPSGASGDGAPEEPRAHPTYLCEVAEKAGEVIGFILGDVQAWQFGIQRCGRIIAIGVRPGNRRGGVASRLARELLEGFRKMNLPLVQCLVRTGDPLGVFFGSMGFCSSPWETMEKRLD